MLLFIIGILGTWVVAHIYYRRACRDQNVLYEKLSCNARRWILDDQRTHLSVEDLNGLLDEKTIDRDSDYPFPYKVCLKCGSSNIYRDRDVDADATDVDEEGLPVFSPMYYSALQCGDCGWRVSELDAMRDRHRAQR